jgi:predicted dehydrogenase
VLRIGIVGAPFAAELHAANLHRLPGTRVERHGVCARTRTQADTAIARVFTDYRDLVESPEVDVVDICATTNAHTEIAVAAAQAGKHVTSRSP